MFNNYSLFAGFFSFNIVDILIEQMIQRNIYLRKKKEKKKRKSHYCCKICQTLVCFAYLFYWVGDRCGWELCNICPCCLFLIKGNACTFFSGSALKTHIRRPL
ncbi:hypothetical protein XENTR_v10020434 [Xenopus tropicalis]|nr:hypothetical protein XENTR_v10020434 [Xenopus tropicalis]